MHPIVKKTRFHLIFLTKQPQIQDFKKRADIVFNLVST
jgi:hypothetical protein